MRYLLGTLTLLSLLHFTSLPTLASLVFFSERSLFEQANPNLPVEDFEEARFFGSDAEALSQPLDSTTNNTVFAAGEILEGIAFGISEDLPDPLSIDFKNFDSKTLTSGVDAPPNGTSLEIVFPGANALAVGFDLYVFTPPIVAANAKIDIFDTTGLLHSTTVKTSATGAVFFGVSSDNPISRISILGDVPGYYEFEAIDNVAFKLKSAPVPKSTSLLSFLALGVVGVVSILKCKLNENKLTEK